MASISAQPTVLPQTQAVIRASLMRAPFVKARVTVDVSQLPRLFDGPRRIRTLRLEGNDQKHKKLPLKFRSAAPVES